MVITKLTLPRRTFLRGMGATLALPLLDAMVPALSARAPETPRFAAIYVGNGMNMFDWTPPTEGVGRRPCGRSSRSATGCSSSAGSTTIRRLTRATPVGNIRAPHRRS